MDVVRQGKRKAKEGERGCDSNHSKRMAISSQEESDATVVCAGGDGEAAMDTALDQAAVPSLCGTVALLQPVTILMALTTKEGWEALPRRQRRERSAKDDDEMMKS